MALRAPSHLPLLPYPNWTIYDPVPANAAYPQGIDTYQHALATAGAQRGYTVGMYLTDGNTANLIVPVPPSVVYMKLVVLLEGVGGISIDSTNNGIAKAWTAANLNAATPSNAFTFETSAVPGLSGTAPLKVRSSAAWTWVTEAVTVTFSSDAGGGDGVILGISFIPIWEPTET